MHAKKRKPRLRQNSRQLSVYCTNRAGGSRATSHSAPTFLRINEGGECENETYVEPRIIPLRVAAGKRRLDRHAAGWVFSLDWMYRWFWDVPTRGRSAK